MPLAVVGSSAFRQEEPCPPPIPIDLLPELLARRGVVVALRGRLVVHEADLEMVEAYFRAYLARPHRRGAGAPAEPGKR